MSKSTATTGELFTRIAVRVTGPHPADALGEPEPHPDWPGEPSSQDAALERDITHVLERIQAEPSRLRRHQMWRVYAAKVRMRSDAQIRRTALEGRG